MLLKIFMGDKLLNIFKSGKSRETTHESTQFVSPIFIVKKPDNVED